jgi:hypothetical protein
MPSLYDALKSSYSDKNSERNLMKEGYVKDGFLSNRNNQVWVNKDNKKLLHTVKGTNPFSLKDIGTDLYLGLGMLDKTDRYKDSKRILENAKQKYNGYETSVAGHSLGGSIASKIGKREDKVYSYNEGISPFQPTRTRGGNHQHFRNSGDVVSILGANSKNQKLLANPYYKTRIPVIDALNSHNINSIKNSNIRI